MAFLRCNDNTGAEVPYTIEGFSFTALPTTQLFTPTDAYKGTSATDHVLANCPTISEFYSLFYDTYINRNIPNYTVTKRSLGKDQSNTYDLYEYDFCPARWERMILLSSGMNGYEIAGIFGLAYFLQQIIENHSADPLLNYLFRKVRIKVIPLINPWGYVQNPKMYTQSRGVNINRNFDIDGRWARYPSYPSQDSNPNNNKGEAPFSEAETQILRNWAEEHLGAEFWIDCHTAASGVTVNKELYTSSLSTSPLYSKGVRAQNLLIAWTKAFYNISTVDTKFQYDSNAALRQWWYEGTFSKGTLVIEQCAECASIGLALNGSSTAIYNYFMLVYAYVGSFLEKADVTVVDKNNYITDLTQDYVDTQKYWIPHDIVRPALTSITAIKTKTTYEVGETFSTSDIVTTAHYSDNTSAIVNGTIDASNVDTSTAGSYVVNISYTEGGVTATTTITITVTAQQLPTLTLKQGSLSSSTGEPTESNARIYIEDYIPVTTNYPDTFHALNCAGNGYVCFMRTYQSNHAFVGSILKQSSYGAGMYYVSGNDSDSGSSGISDDIIIAKRQGTSATCLRIVFLHEDKTTPIAPADLEGRVITVDGVEYVLQV